VAKAFRYADLDATSASSPTSTGRRPTCWRACSARATRAGLARLAGPVPDALASLPPNVAALNRMLYLEIKFFLTDHNLNYVDKVSMASGVEVRVPMLDPELMALAAGCRCTSSSAAATASGSCARRWSRTCRTT